MEEIFVFALWILFAVWTAIVADRRGRNAAAWLLVGFIFSLAALIVVAVLPPTAQGRLREGSLKKCPHCAELIQPEAVVCRFCNRDLAQPAAAQEIVQNIPAAVVASVTPAPASSGNHAVRIALLLVLGAVVCVGLTMYASNSRRDAEIERKISVAEKACIAGGQIVYAARYIEASQAIEQLDFPAKYERAVSLDNRVQMQGCKPVR